MNFRISRGEKIFNILNIVFLGFCAFITIYPFLYIIAISFSSTRAITSGEVILFPVEFETNAYKIIIRTGQIFRGMKNTVIITLVGTGLNMLFTILGAYSLSKDRLMGKKYFTGIIVFTMMFGGGMIPSFILVKMLGLINTYGALWFPALISVYNLIIMRTFFRALPQSLEEAAQIDGAGDLYILFRIVLPLSKAAIATISLFYAVNWWNEYFHSLIYLTTSTKMPMTIVLMNMLNEVSNVINSASGVSNSDMQNRVTPESVKSATMVISIVPILCVYPFVQKYFVKGVMIGSVKG